MAVDQYLFILPVIFYEFLAISVTRAVIPALFLDSFGPFVYHVIGVVETIKGVLAFIACPLVGKVSDKVGRKVCLLVTVIGTTFPVCILAFTLDMRVYAVSQGIIIQINISVIYSIFLFGSTIGGICWDFHPHICIYCRLC